MNKSYLRFLEFIKLAERKPIRYKRKVKYELSTERLNKLIEQYFTDFEESMIMKSIEFKVSDKADLLFLLRYHFRLWITIKEQTITIYKNFPTQFKIIKEVNKTNHLFTPKTFEVGQILYFKNHGYSSVNWLNGIPLAESLTLIEGTEIIPTTQINYDFIEAILD